MGCIYRIVHIATGQSYVGQTSYSHPFYRFQEHQQSAKNGSVYPLHDALREHGIKAFQCECICDASNESLNDLECYYAEQYNGYIWDGGYNQGECGKAQVRREMTDERRLWIKRRAIWKNRSK